MTALVFSIAFLLNVSIVYFSLDLLHFEFNPVSALPDRTQLKVHRRED